MLSRAQAARRLPKPAPMPMLARLRLRPAEFCRPAPATNLYMNSKIIIPILAVIALGLGVLAFVNHNKIKDQGVTIATYSNDVVTTKTQLLDLQEVQKTTKADLEKRNDEFAGLTITHSNALLTLAKTETELKATEDSLKLSKVKVAELDSRIGKLESDNREYEAQTTELTNKIANLNVQIAATEQKLASAEGDKALLQKELSKLLGEKADLEKKLNDLKFLKQQVAQLKAELSIANRLRFIREGLFAPGEKKGGQLLVERNTTPPPTNNFNLNVEIHSDGTTTPLPQPK
jgi:peptidoglycan hydrolase CwlO-like protein